MKCNSKLIENRFEESFKAFKSDYSYLFKTMPKNWGQKYYLSKEGQEKTKAYFDNLERPYYQINAVLVISSAYCNPIKKTRSVMHSFLMKLDYFCKYFIFDNKIDGAKGVINKFWDEFENGFWPTITEVLISEVLITNKQFNIVRFGAKIPNSDKDADILSRWMQKKIYMEVKNYEKCAQYANKNGNLKDVVKNKFEQDIQDKEMNKLDGKTDLGILAYVFNTLNDEIILEHFNQKALPQDRIFCNNLIAATYVIRIVNDEVVLIGGWK